MPVKKTAILTGATGRLGRSVADELARRGYSVVALVRSVDDALNAGFSAYPCDLTDEESVVTVFEHVRSVHGRIDAVVHTVGMWAAAPLLETRLADWRTVMDVNLTSAFLCLREGARALEAGGGGGMVAIASRQGADQAPSEQAAYAAAKAGVIRLVEAIGAEFADRGVTARVVAPSMILFDGTAGPGISAADLARTCVDLADPTWPMASGSLLRAYGDAG